MQFSVYRSALQKILAERNGYAVLALCNGVLCLLLTGLIFCLIGREKIIVVPPVVEKSFWVTNSQVSAEYLSEMTAFFAYLRLNVTADNASSQHALLLRYTDPSDYNRLKGQLLQEADRLSEQHLSSAFFPASVQVDSPHLTAWISGDLHSSVGEMALPPQRVKYKVTYRWVGGRLFVQTFTQEMSHD